MRSWMPVRDVYDIVLDNVALRSGILLTAADVQYLVARGPLAPFASVYDLSMDEEVGARPEFLEQSVLALRHAVGNIEAPSTGIIEAVQVAEAAGLTRPGAIQLVSSLRMSISPWQYVADHSSIVPGLMEQFALPARFEPLLTTALELLRDRSLRLDSVEATEWEGVTPLASLFEAELVPDDPALYLDQRFIDYLAAQGESLQKIHWRNFERLVAEFFRRRGYVVSLGPGRADGGVDIRVWPEGGAAGPPLLLIQCKRYGESRDVSVEVVKALWSDV